MKRIILLSAAPLLYLSAYANSSDVSEESTVSFSTSSEIVVKSATALVNVIVNATALQGDNTIVQKAAIDSLTSILAKIDWKIVDYKETQADSGAQNIRLMIQARLTDQEIKTLQKELKNHNSNNSRFQVEIVNFNPTNAMLNQAQNNEMISMYQSIQQYVNDFNGKTNNHYFIRSVNYSVNDTSSETPRSVMYNRMDSPEAQSKDNLTISKKLIISAYVTLAQKNGENSAKAQNISIAATNMLPPVYLQISGYKQCLQTTNKGSWTAWCMPNTQPQGCSSDTWEALMNLKTQGKLSGMDECTN